MASIHCTTRASQKELEAELTWNELNVVKQLRKNILEWNRHEVAALRSNEAFSPQVVANCKKLQAEAQAKYNTIMQRAIDRYNSK